MAATVFTDAEAAVRTWLRQELTDLDGRVFFAIPDGSPTFPLITVGRLGGGPQIGEAELEDVRLECQVWAKNKKTAVDVVRALTSLVFTAADVALDPEVWCYGFTVDSVTWAPDPSVKLSRYVVDLTATVRVLS